MGVMTKRDVIFTACKKATGLDISAKTRKREVVYVKYIYYFYARKLSDVTLVQLGEPCNKAGHDTVIYGIGKFKEYSVNEDFIKLHNKCARAINSTKVFDEIELMYDKTMVSTDVLLDIDGSVTKRAFKEYIANLFFVDDMAKDLMKMSKKEIEDMRDNKIKPHLRMLRSKVNYKQFNN